ncbi:hypothetical protein C6P46_002481 [Rhodotorula mucilaginosa]|uniref:Uncharacterized protein n=1 Tax=Rhodotorula mucilaginosa TaxID=5537 RepID=A0A9P6VTP4_RHOMI|nr:hypothetical protein C6P46_002481 [Rhodotorula mucilaginosa]TKA51643.1 hypothetical protein B0A53_05520 [Rhodotorula sp. CCFEE 5036]
MAAAAKGAGQPARGPKLAELFLKTHERQPQPLSGSQAQFVETHFEVEDASAYADALLAFEGIIDRLHYPSRHQIRMLLSMCFFPLFFKPPVQHGSATMRPSTSASSSIPRIVPLADDPLVLSQRQIRQLARDLLADVIGTCGIGVVCDAIKGYGMPLAEGGGSVSRADSEEPPAHKYFGKKQKGKKSGANLGQDHPDFETPVDSDDPLAAAANLMLDAPDLWEVLAGTTAVKRRLRTSEQPVLDTGGWEVLRELVRGWEAEAIRKKKAGESGVEPPAPLSLLRYFKPSASTGAARELSTKALDVVFWPFSEYAHDDEGVESDADVDREDGKDAEEEEEGGEESGGSGLEDLRDTARRSRKRSRQQEKAEKAKRRRQAAEADGMSLFDKRLTAVKLLGLIGECTVSGSLSSKTVVSELAHWLKALEYQDFHALLDVISLAMPCPLFVARLFWTYLEIHSHPAAATVGLTAPQARVDLTPQAPVSPRKLAAQGARGHPRTSSSTKSFWQVPGLSSREFISLVARVPIEVPLPATTSSTTTTTTSSQTSSSSMPKNLERAAKAVEIHRVVKTLLSELLAERDDGAPPSQDQVQTVVDAIAVADRVLEDARTTRASAA